MRQGLSCGVSEIVGRLSTRRPVQGHAAYFVANRLGRLRPGLLRGSRPLTAELGSALNGRLYPYGGAGIFTHSKINMLSGYF